VYVDAAGELPYKGFVDCFAKSIKNEGVLGLWVGLPTFYSRMAPHAMITVLLQDFFHDLLSGKKAGH
jgi:solute carrier family 25 (mitochondrial oxoglutarate transporter), member 11